MAGWGAMMGLGQGLQQVSGMMLDNYKSKMKEQLEIEKEKRADTRAETLREREKAEKLATPVKWQPLDNPDGTMSQQGYNHLNQPIDGLIQPMSHYEAKEFRRSQELAELESRAKSLEVTLSGKRVDAFDTDKDLDRRKDEASIESSLASAAASRARAANPGGSRSSVAVDTVSNEQNAVSLLKEYDGLVKDYAKSKDNPNGLTQEELLHMAKAAIVEAQGRRLNAREVFRTALGSYASKRAESRGK